MSPTRRRLLAASVVVALLIVGLIWRTRSRETSTTTAPATSPLPRTLAPLPTQRTAPLAYRLGDQLLGLSGIVIDQDDRPVVAEVRLAGRTTRTTKSADDGSFTFTELTAGSYFVEAWTEAAAATPKRVHLTPGVAPLVLRVHAAAQLAITCLNLEDERAIVGAAVDLLPHPQMGDEPVRSGVTDGRGKVVMRGLFPGNYAVVASAVGFRTSEAPLQPQAGLAWQATVRMVAGAPLSGRVVDDQARPVEGAVIIPLPASLASAYIPRPRNSRHLSRSNREGEFILPALDEGQFILRATHPSFLPGQSAAIDSDGKRAHSGIEIVLAPGGSISGQVVDSDGVAQPGAMVRVNALDPSVTSAGLRLVTSDRDGKFELGGLPLVAVELVADTAQASSMNLGFDLSETARVTGALIRLDNDGVIQGTVTDSEGTPIADAEVVCVGHKIGAIGLRPVFPETTDEEGRFAFTALPDNEFELTARRPYANNNQSPWMRSAGTSARVGTTVNIILPGDGSVVGKVELSDGSVAKEFELSIDQSGTAIRYQAEDGHFVLDGLAPRDYTLVVAVGTRRTEVAVSVPEGGAADVGTVVISAY